MTITVIATPSVRADQLKLVVAERGLQWSRVGHVTATTTLADAIMRDGQFACPIGPLLQMAIDAIAGTPSHASFPGSVRFRELGADEGGYDAYRSQWRDWTRKARRRRLGQALRFDEELRSFIRTRPSDQSPAAVLVRGRRQFEAATRLLIASGFVPDDVRPTTATERLAVAAWRVLEATIPQVTVPRRALWEGDPSSMTRELRELVDGIFGAGNVRLTLVHHGFYFFTPQQWRFFRVIEECGVADQLFLVHHDGDLPVFDVWSSFFDGRWNLPDPVTTRIPGHVRSKAAVAVAGALRGRRVEPGDLATSLAIREGRSPAELVRLWRDTDDHDTRDGRKINKRGQRFAANSDEVVRFVQRLWGAGAEEDIDLAQLPVGAFLLTLHAALHVDDFGRVSVRLTQEQLGTIARTGFVAVDEYGTSDAFLAALDRARPFFRHCRSAAEWRAGARELEALVTEAGQIQRSRVASPDLDRISAASSGYLTVVPWVDLTAEEARAVRSTIESLVELLEHLASKSRVTWNSHWAVVEERLRQGMKGVSPDERRMIDERMSEVSIGLDGEIHLDGIIDAVSMVLGRSVEFDNSDDMADVEAAAVSEPRAIDALGFTGAEGAFHLANLADRAFPAKIGGIGWPFRPENVGGGPIEAREILALRSNAGTLSSLYLFWLALDAATDNSPITLSWISQMGTESRAPSPFISLIARPQGMDPALADAIGGIPIREVSPADQITTEVDPLTPVASTDDQETLKRAIARLPRKAAAAALGCPRRFALQWALGDSAAFNAEHHWLMAYGNVVGALEEDGCLTAEAARQFADRIWSNFTDGERESSFRNRVVRPGPSADPSWILTLKGSRYGQGKLDQAYRAAKGQAAPDQTAVAPAGHQFLPLGVEFADVCMLCPVRTKCLYVVIE